MNTDATIRLHTGRSMPVLGPGDLAAELEELDGLNKHASSLGSLPYV